MKDDKIYELTQYAEYEGSELGECLNLLIGLHNFRDYISEKFEISLEKELNEQLRHFKENTYWHKETVTTEEEITTLEWML